MSLCFSRRMSSESSELGSRAVRSGVRPGSRPVWRRRPGPLDAHAERRTGGQRRCLSLEAVFTRKSLKT